MCLLFVPENTFAGLTLVQSGSVKPIFRMCVCTHATSPTCFYAFFSRERVGKWWVGAAETLLLGGVMLS